LIKHTTDAVALEGRRSLGRCDGHGCEDAARVLRADGSDRSPHRRAGREPVVDKHDVARSELRRRPVAAVAQLACLDGGTLACGHLREHGGRDGRFTKNVFIEDVHPAARDRAHRQLRLRGVEFRTTNTSSGAPIVLATAALPQPRARTGHDRPVRVGNSPAAGRSAIPAGCATTAH
jgi:hypothetical protein